jgi:adenylate cyclase
MPELEAWYDPNGTGQMEFKHSWELPEDRALKLGSQARALVEGEEHACDVVADWDRTISRFHAHLRWFAGLLHVRRRKEKTQNEIVYDGREQTEFAIGRGESFLIGRTTFRLPANETAALVRRHSDLWRLPFVNADQRLEALSELPELLRYAPDEERLQQQLLEVLLKGIPQADSAAIVAVDRERSTLDDPQVAVKALAVRPGATDEFRPSRRLVYKSVVSAGQSMIHVWDPATLGGGGPCGAEAFTLPPSGSQRAGTDFAICYPLSDQSPPQQGLYVCGRLPQQLRSADAVSRDSGLNSDLKFAALTAEVYSSVRQALHLDKTCRQLGRFLAPIVVGEILTGRKSIDEIFRRELTEVTVLFCDLRGFSRMVEGGREDLEQMWDSISQALEFMTGPIVENRGAIGDFQGDAAMGFWGWPEKRADQVVAAAQAALTIRRRFDEAAKRRGGLLSCGIGLAYGRAIAGLLGTFDQKKVGVFGPVVNLASRLESLTKQLRASILIDPAVAQVLGQPAHRPWCRVRDLAVVKLAGLDEPVAIAELLPPVNYDGPNLPEPLRQSYAHALRLFQDGKWDRAAEMLGKMVRQDLAAEFLKNYIESHGGRPPAGWSGVIELERK